MFAYGIFKVLYSPLKAFKEIVENPTYKAPVLILILVLLITAGANCISKLEIVMPEKEEWSESDLFWKSNGAVSLDSTDRITGNHSVSALISNATDIYMSVKDVGPVNCTGNDGYKKLVFGIKWEAHNGEPASPSGFLRLFSGENGSFEQSVTGWISNTSDQWSDVDLDVGLESENWSETDPQGWGKIDGLEFRLTWPSEQENITLKLDGLFFGGRYTPAIASEDFGYVLSWSLIRTGINFFLNWAVFAGTLFIILKLYGEKAGSFKLLFRIVGYVLSTLIVINLIGVVLVLTNVWSSALLLLVSLAFHIWSVALYAIAIHTLREFTWRSSLTTSVTAYLLGLMLINLLFVF